MFEIFIRVGEFFIWFVENYGYWGIFFTLIVESSFVPLPSELTLIPAGMLIRDSILNASLVLIVSIIGTIIGSLINYYIAKYCGRRLLRRYGKYMFLNDSKIKIMDDFFKKHGSLSVFFGRLLPGIKHVISFPAGLASMNIFKFCGYTALGSAIWNGFLIILGYIIGGNTELIKSIIKRFNYIIIAIVVVFIIYYIHKKITKESIKP